MSTAASILAYPPEPKTELPFPPALAKRLKSFPACVASKLSKLRRAETRARAMIEGLQAEYQRVLDERGEAQRDLGLWDHRNRAQTLTVMEKGKRVEVEHPERVALRERIEAANAELRRISEDRDAMVYVATEPLVSWLLRQDFSARFMEGKAPLPKIGKHDTLAAAYERNREAQARISQELATVANAPRTAQEAKAAMRAEIALLAERGRVEVSGLFDGAALKWPTESLIGVGAEGGAVSATLKDALGVAVWANKDALIRVLEAEIDRDADDANALSSQDQAARLAALEAELLHLQRQAEIMIERLEGDGIPVQRACLLPEVLLGIERAPS